MNDKHAKKLRRHALRGIDDSVTFVPTSYTTAVIKKRIKDGKDEDGNTVAQHIFKDVVMLSPTCTRAIYHRLKVDFPTPARSAT